MKNLSGDPNLDIPKTNRRSLRKLGLDQQSIEDVIRLQRIYNEVKDLSPVDVKTVRDLIDDAIKALETDIKDAEAELELIDDIEGKIEHVEVDMQKLQDLVNKLPQKGKIPKKDLDSIIKTVEQLMKDLASDPKLDANTVTAKNLRIKKLDPHCIDEIMGLKEINDYLKSTKPKESSTIKEMLDKVMKNVKKELAELEEELEVLETNDDHLHKQHDANVLKDLENMLGDNDKTNEKQNYEIKMDVQAIIKDLTGDLNIDFEHLTRDDLKKRGLDDHTIDEIMKLKKIQDEVSQGKPVDANMLKHQLDEVMHEIEDDAKSVKSEKVQPVESKAQKLKVLRDSLPKSGKSNGKINKEVEDTVTDTIRDIVGDRSINPDTITKKQLQKAEVDPEFIEDVLKLKKLNDQIKLGKAIPIKSIRDVIDDVILNIEKHEQEIKSERDLDKKEDSYDQKIHDADKLEEMIDKMGDNQKMDSDMIYELQMELKRIMQDLSGNKNLNPEKVTKRELRNQG